MAHSNFSNHAQQVRCGIPASRSSYHGYDSLDCFGRKHYCGNSGGCERCGSCVSCLSYKPDKGNVNGSEATVTPDTYIDDHNFVRCSSEISSKSEVITPDISEQATSTIRASELQDSLYSKLWTEELKSYELLDSKLEGQFKLFTLDVSNHKNEPSNRDVDDILRIYNQLSLIDGKISESSLTNSPSSDSCDSLKTVVYRPTTYISKKTSKYKYADLEAKLKDFIPRSTINYNNNNKVEANKTLDSERVTVVNDVEVAIPLGKDTKHSAVKLAAEVMNLPYEDFKETVSYELPTQKSAMTACEIMKRIKDAYDLCSCKVCECISSISAPALKKYNCDRKPDDCIDCNKNEMANYERKQMAYYGPVRKYEKQKIRDCKCDPCQCDKCKYYEDRKHFTNKLCNCTPCQCVECKVLSVNKNRTVIVAPASEDNQRRPYCSCTTCGCFDCAHPYGTIAQTRTRTVTQDMSTETATIQHMNCACQPCGNANCEQEGANTCNCNRNNKVVRKPVQNENNDYDIHKVLVSHSLGANKLHGIINRDIELPLLRTFSRDVMGRQHFCEQRQSNDCVNLKKTRKVSNILDILHPCKQSEQQVPKPYNLAELQASEIRGYHKTDIDRNCSEDPKDSNESLCFIISKQYENASKPYECSDCLQFHTSHQQLVVEEKHLTSSILLGGYINHIIYDKSNSQSSSSDLAETEESEDSEEPHVKSSPNYYVFNYQDETNKFIENIKNRCKTKAVMKADISAGHNRERQSSNTSISSNSPVTSSQTSDNNRIIRSWNNSDIFSHEYSDDLFQFTFPRTTVQECVRDVMEINNINRILNVAFTSGSRKNNSDSIVPRRIQTVRQENARISPSCSKTIASQITQVKLCDKFSYAEPCECDLCRCNTISIEKWASKCTCNCSACDCFDVCLHQKSVSKNCKFAQTSPLLISADHKDGNTSGYPYNDPTKLHNYWDKEECGIPIPILNMSQQSSQQVNILRQNNIKLPEETKYNENHAPHSHHTLTSEDDGYRNVWENYHNDNAQRLLQQAKACSYELTKILRKYEKANKEFKSVSRKLRQSHQSLLKLDTEIKAPATMKTCKIDNAVNEVKCLGVKKDQDIVINLRNDENDLNIKPKEAEEPIPLIDKNKPKYVNEKLNTGVKEAEKIPLILKLDTSLIKNNTKSNEAKRGQSLSENYINNIKFRLDAKEGTKTAEVKYKIKPSLNEKPNSTLFPKTKTVMKKSSADINKTRVVSHEKKSETVKSNKANEIKTENKNKYTENESQQTKVTGEVKKQKHVTVKFDDTTIEPKETKESLLFETCEPKTVTDLSNTDEIQEKLPVCQQLVASAINNKQKLNKKYDDKALKLPRSNSIPITFHKHSDIVVDNENSVQENTTKSAVEDINLNINIKSFHPNKNRSRENINESAIFPPQKETTTAAHELVIMKPKYKDESSAKNNEYNCTNSENYKEIRTEAPHVQGCEKDMLDCLIKPLSLRKSKDQVNIGLDLTESKNDAVCVESIQNLAKSQVVNYKQESSEKCKLNQSTEQYVIKNDYDRLANEIYKSITSTSDSHQRVRSKGKPNAFNKNFMNESIIETHDLPKQFEFINILNFIKKYRPDLYQEIAKVNFSPKCGSGQVSEVKVIFKDDGDDIKRNDSYEMKVIGDENKNVSKFFSIKALKDLRTKAVTELYGKIFGENDVFTSYFLPTLNIDRIFDNIQLESIIDMQLIVTKALKGSLDSNASKKYQNNNTQLELFTTTSKSLSKCSDNSVVNNMKATVSKELHQNSKMCDVQPQLGSIPEAVRSCLSDLKLYEEANSTHYDDYNMVHNIEVKEDTNSAELDEQNEQSNVSDKLLDDKKLMEKSLKAENNSFQDKLKVFSGSRRGSQVNIRTIRKVSNHTLFLEWDVPKDTKNIQGYKLLVDGRQVDKMLSPHRGTAVVTCLPRSERVIVTVRSITKERHPSTKARN